MEIKSKLRANACCKTELPEGIVRGAIIIGWDFPQGNCSGVIIVGGTCLEVIFQEKRLS